MRYRARAQALVWVTAMLPLVFLPIIGLSIDAGVLFDARRDLQNIADGAARAGAQRIDTSDLTFNMNGRMRINPSGASTTVREYADRMGVTIGDPTFSADNTEIAVRVSRRVEPRFLRIVRVRGITIDAIGHAVACQGIVDSPCH